jgi:thiol-disulfide isomerase/thioredoxin
LFDDFSKRAIAQIFTSGRLDLPQTPWHAARPRTQIEGGSRDRTLNASSPREDFMRALSWVVATLSLVILSVNGCSSKSNSDTTPVDDTSDSVTTDTPAVVAEAPVDTGPVAPAYPIGTCGIQVGATIANLTFTGKNGGDTSPQQTFALADFYDPTGSKGRKILVIDVSALWCTACKEEMKQLPKNMADYGPKGVTFMTVLAENSSNAPASAADVDTWIKSFHLTNIVVNDPTLSTEAFFDRASMPLNMIIDLRTMCRSDAVSCSRCARSTSSVWTRRCKGRRRRSGSVPSRSPSLRDCRIPVASTRRRASRFEIPIRRAPQAWAGSEPRGAATQFSARARRCVSTQ